MRPRKARSPATADAGREAHASFRFGNRERREATTKQTSRPVVYVYDGRGYCGRVQQVDTGRWVATTHTGAVVGSFTTQRQASRALPLTDVKGGERDA